MSKTIKNVKIQNTPLSLPLVNDTQLISSYDDYSIKFYLKNKDYLIIKEDGIYFRNSDDILQLVETDKDLLYSFRIIIEQLLNGNINYFNQNTPSKFIQKFKKDIINEFLLSLNIKNERLLKINQLIK